MIIVHKDGNSKKTKSHLKGTKNVPLLKTLIFFNGKPMSKFLADIHPWQACCGSCQQT